jgi:hypothetical protein
MSSSGWDQGWPGKHRSACWRIGSVLGSFAPAMAVARCASAIPFPSALFDLIACRPTIGRGLTVALRLDAAYGCDSQTEVWRGDQLRRGVSGGLRPGNRGLGVDRGCQRESNPRKRWNGSALLPIGITRRTGASFPSIEPQHPDRAKVLLKPEGHPGCQISKINRRRLTVRHDDPVSGVLERLGRGCDQHIPLG